jgi:tetrapyrrole methylase family protein/MazG family protein
MKYDYQDTTRKYDFNDLIEIIAQLRGPGGCPWDIEQTHESLKKCLQEEAGEVMEAIDNKDDANLCEELGDLLLQVVMHAQIASETGRFTMDDVIQGVAAKMVRRHPHVFGDAKASNSEESLNLWAEIKKQEKEKGNR